MCSTATPVAAAPSWAAALPALWLLARAQAAHADARDKHLHHRQQCTGHKHCAKRLRQAARALLATAARVYHASPRAALDRAAASSAR
ncbi:hypothetical protein [Hymenobacter aerophilus]|uniref:hypothetical protein n=1 Tax=Hymenobacter aerophilus TaxID=119644 RepID=UPI0003644A0D|nr:hypothetical protein [Hymenobacter aerophilus]